MMKSAWVLFATLAVFVFAGPAAAQVKSANPATAWVYVPNVTVNDLWRGVREGSIQVISTAATNSGRGGFALVTVFKGQGEVWRCVENTDSGMVEQNFACARVR